MSSAIPISVYVAISPLASSPPFIHAATQRSWLTRSVVCPRVTVLSGASFLYCPRSGRHLPETATCCCSRSGAIFCLVVPPPLTRRCPRCVNNNRFTSEADQIRALTEMQGLYCKSRPSMSCFNFAKSVLSLTFRYPLSLSALVACNG